ncbi:MAG: YdaS family helix-turn-helix protein [Sphingomonas fennica]
MDRTTLHAALRAAVAKAGGGTPNQSRFALAIGCSQQLVSYWLKGGKPLPAEYVLPAERAGFGSRFDLRPDIYPVEPYRAPSATEAA